MDKGVKHTERSIILDLAYSGMHLQVRCSPFQNNYGSHLSESKAIQKPLLDSSIVFPGVQSIFTGLLRDFAMETVCEMQSTYIHLPAIRLFHQEMWWRKPLLSFNEIHSLSLTSVSGQMTAYLVSSPIKHLSVCCASYPD